MENDKLDLQVGDRVTYKYENENEIHTEIISDTTELKDYKYIRENLFNRNPKNRTTKI